MKGKKRLQQVPCIKAPHAQNKNERLCTIDEIFSNMHRGLRARKKRGASMKQPATTLFRQLEEKIF
jgi:hypothetical protein